MLNHDSTRTPGTHTHSEGQFQVSNHSKVGRKGKESPRKLSLHITNYYLLPAHLGLVLKR